MLLHAFACLHVRVFSLLSLFINFLPEWFTAFPFQVRSSMALHEVERILRMSDRSKGWIPSRGFPRFMDETGKSSAQDLGRRWKVMKSLTSKTKYYVDPTGTSNRKPQKSRYIVELQWWIQNSKLGALSLSHTHNAICYMGHVSIGWWMTILDVTLPLQELNERDIFRKQILGKAGGSLHFPAFLLQIHSFWFDQFECFGICLQIPSVFRYGGAVDWPHCEAGADEQQRHSQDTENGTLKWFSSQKTHWFCPRSSSWKRSTP